MWKACSCAGRAQGTVNRCPLGRLFSEWKLKIWSFFYSKCYFPSSPAGSVCSSWQREGQNKQQRWETVSPRSQLALGFIPSGFRHVWRLPFSHSSLSLTKPLRHCPGMPQEGAAASLKVATSVFCLESCAAGKAINEELGSLCIVK